MKTKKCIKCNLDKKICEFFNSKRSKDGFSTVCKLCNNIRGKNYVKNNSEKEKIRGKKWTKNNPEKVREKEKRYLKKNQEKRLRWRKEYERKRKKNIAYRLKSNYSSLLSTVFKYKGVKKPKKTLLLLGCDIDFFFKYIENKFIDGMTFENYGKWHLDHIIPISSAGDDLEKLIKLCHYTNLQPLWAIDNIRKGNKIYDMSI